MGEGELLLPSLSMLRDNLLTLLRLHEWRETRVAAAFFRAMSSSSLRVGGTTGPILAASLEVMVAEGGANRGLGIKLAGGGLDAGNVVAGGVATTGRSLRPSNRRRKMSVSSGTSGAPQNLLPYSEACGRRREGCCWCC